MDPDPASIISSIFAIDLPQLFGVIAAVLLLISSALISGAEVAFFSLTPADFEVDEAKRSVKENIVIALLDKPKKLLATILVANNMINIAIILLFDTLTDTAFENINTVFFGINLKFIMEVVVVTFLILLFGEILPKVYASRNKVAFSHFMAYPLNFLDSFFSPLSVPMRSLTVFIHERLGNQKSGLSVDQLSQALELTSQHDTTKEEQKILKGIVDRKSVV